MGLSGDPGVGIGGYNASDYGGAEFGGTGENGDPGFSGGPVGGPDGPADPILPAAPPAAPTAAPPPAKPQAEKKDAVERKARKRSLLTGEGIEEQVYRRSILGG